MVIIQEKEAVQEGTSIRSKFNQEISVLEILKNTSHTILETTIIGLSRWLKKAMDDGTPITMTFMTPNGSYDVGEVDHLDNKHICISSVGASSPYDFPISSIQKVYCVNFSSAKGFFCMGRNHNSIYLRDY